MVFVAIEDIHRQVGGLGVPSSAPFAAATEQAFQPPYSRCRSGNSNQAARERGPEKGYPVHRPRQRRTLEMPAVPTTPQQLNCYLWTSTIGVNLRMDKLA